MIDINPLKIGDRTALGIRVNLPESPPLLLMIGERGFVMCGFLNIDAADKLKVAAVMVSGVKSFDDVLRAEVRAVTSKASKIGIGLGMTGRDAIRLLL